MMKKKLRVSLFWAAAISSAALMLPVGPASAQEGILLKARATGDSNYCHLKFPAIRPDTLYSGRPVLQDPSTGAIVDFYGSCDYDPTSKAEVFEQKRAQRSKE